MWSVSPRQHRLGERLQPNSLLFHNFSTLDSLSGSFKDTALSSLKRFLSFFSLFSFSSSVAAAAHYSWKQNWETTTNFFSMFSSFFFSFIYKSRSMLNRHTLSLLNGGTEPFFLRKSKSIGHTSICLLHCPYVLHSEGRSLYNLISNWLQLWQRWSSMVCG